MEGNPFTPTPEAFSHYCRLIYDRHLAAGTGGNVAARCGPLIWLTPGGCSLRDIQPDRIAVLDEVGSHLQGARPTKEAGMHLRVLGTRPDIHVVLHVHGAPIIAASLLLEPGPSSLPALTPGFVFHAFPLPMLPFMVPGSPELASGVDKALSGPGSRAVMLQNHGLVTVGRDFDEALDIAEEIDEAARVFLLSQGRGPLICEGHILRIQSFRG